jgi:hypothetical protein
LRALKEYLGEFREDYPWAILPPLTIALLVGLINNILLAFSGSFSHV